MSDLPIHIAMTLAFFESIGLAALLWARARDIEGMRLLNLFLLGLAVWMAGCELPSWFGASASWLGGALIAFSPLTSAVFLNFVMRLAKVPTPKAVLAAIYAVGGVTTLVALVSSPGTFMPWRGIAYFFMPNMIGWALGIVWALLALCGHLVMAIAWFRVSGLAKRQLMAMCWSSGWGACCVAGYAFPPLGIDLYPYPLLLLPVYPLFLVYGILRYRMMVANVWARRAIAWTLLVGLGSACVIGLAALPLPLGGVNSGWRLWAAAVATLLVSGLLLDPFRRFATRLVYPGSSIGEDRLDHWRIQLNSAESPADLEAIAARELSAFLHIPVFALVGRERDESAVEDGRPVLRCIRRLGRWRSELVGWDAAPPGPRQVAHLFGTLLAEAARTLDQAIAFAERERDFQRQARLAELGALAATVAHDIRNPLNIIAMAAAGAPPEVRSEISLQTARISQLASDLLDYAKPWRIDPITLDLGDHVRATLSRYESIEIGPGLAGALAVEADPRRLTQALGNLLDNAVATRVGGREVRIAIDAECDPSGAVRLHLCDNGPGIPDDIRATLFQPFVSRSPNGTGLGLAIVAKIMETHGGVAGLSEKPDWSTCFTLTFPARPA